MELLPLRRRAERGGGRAMSRSGKLKKEVDPATALVTISEHGDVCEVDYDSTSVNGPQSLYESYVFSRTQSLSDEIPQLRGTAGATLAKKDRIRLYELEEAVKAQRRSIAAIEISNSQNPLKVGGWLSCSAPV